MLEKLLSKIEPGKYEFEGKVLEYKVTDNGYMVRVYSKNEPESELQEYIESFKEYVKNVDDDVFVETCELFAETSGMSTHELSVILDNADDYGKVCAAVTNFKDCLRKIVTNKIEYLQDKYLNIDTK